MALTQPLDHAAAFDDSAAFDDAAAGLRAALGERILTPADPGYDDARLGWNRVVDQHPAAIALPESAEDVVAVVRASATAGLKISVQSTGHGAAATAGRDLSRTVMINLRNLRGVTVGPAARTARVLGGTLWAEVLEAAAPYGLTGLHGTAPDVSVAGYCLSGGVSLYGRRHGLAVNTVRAVRLVTADGGLVTASATENPDLFWAVRGGAGEFGIAVSLEIDLIAQPDVYAGMLLWDADHALEIARAWAEWSGRAPESATTTMRIMHFPPVDVPPFLAGRSVAVIDGAICATDASAAALLKPLRALEPEMDTFGRMPAAALGRVHLDPPHPVPAVGGHAMLSQLGGGAIDRAAMDGGAMDAFVGAALAARPMISELRHCGGALARRPEGAGAIGSLGGGYLLNAIAIPPSPELVAAATASTRAVVEAMAPWHGEGLALTFIDAPDVDTRPGFGEASARLRELKDLYDPDGVLVAAHPIPQG